MTTYEWDVEELDELGDVLDHSHQLSYAACLVEKSKIIEDGGIAQIVLVRDSDKGRHWAYIVEEQLETVCTDAMGCTVKTPEKYLDEVTNKAIQTPIKPL